MTGRESLFSTPWTRLIRRVLHLRRVGAPIRVQAFLDGEWRYVGQRR